MEIRAFDPEDEAAVVALWEECELTRPWNDAHKDIARKLSVQREFFLVGKIGEGHRGWVNYLAVAPGFRGRGFARALMAHVETLLLARGCPKVSLLVRGSNPEAIAFYRHLGYVRDDSVALGKRLIPDAMA